MHYRLTYLNLRVMAIDFVCAIFNRYKYAYVFVYAIPTGAHFAVQDALLLLQVLEVRSSVVGIATFDNDVSLRLAWEASLSDVSAGDWIPVCCRWWLGIRLLQ